MITDFKNGVRVIPPIPDQSIKSRDNRDPIQSMDGPNSSLAGLVPLFRVTRPPPPKDFVAERTEELREESERRALMGKAKRGAVLPPFRGCTPRKNP